MPAKGRGVTNISTDHGAPDGWIRASDRMPDAGKVVLAWLGGRVVFGYSRDGEWIDTLYGWVIPNGPTHWMPLPPPPCELDH